MFGSFILLRVPKKALILHLDAILMIKQLFVFVKAFLHQT